MSSGNDFFVLSGFFISASVLKLIIRGEWSWKRYLTNRIVRLWIVLLPALLLIYIWNIFSIALYGDQAIVGEMSWETLLTNIFFLQGLRGFPFIPFGHNEPLWSLSYEFWYYILFPCIVLVLSSKKILNKLIYGILAIIIGIMLGKNGMLLFLVWLLGTVVLLLPRINIPKNSILKIGLLIAPILMFFAAMVLSGREKTFLINFIVGLTFSAIVYTFIIFYNGKYLTKNSLFGRISLILAGFSYTLYLTHYPVNNFIKSFIGERYLLQPTVANIGLFILTLILIISYAWLISIVTEAKTDKVRSLVTRVTAGIFVRGKNQNEAI
ncbi:acyltransferase [Paenibacillus sp. P26]|nr:acyltransferase [Paenibacillus sp. P26]